MKGLWTHIFCIFILKWEKSGLRNDGFSHEPILFSPVELDEIRVNGEHDRPQTYANTGGPGGGTDWGADWWIYQTLSDFIKIYKNLHRKLKVGKNGGDKFPRPPLKRGRRGGGPL